MGGLDPRCSCCCRRAGVVGTRQMDVQLDLNPLPALVAIDIVRWLAESPVNEQQLQQVAHLIESMYVTPVPNVDWTVDITEAQGTFIVLKWGSKI